MNYSNASSEIIESLELLRPPVKRIPDKTLKDKTINVNLVVPTYKGEIRRLHKYIPKNITYSKAKDPINSSISLIEKKSSGRQILGKYSVVSYTTLLHPTYRKDHHLECSNENKPLIKVTVIPKTQQTQIGRLQRKPGHNTKRVQKTASNHENSIQPTKLFPIVIGETEKIYEIRPSESDQLSCGQIESKFIYEKNVVEGIANIKELIKSLEMDKKKTKNKKNKINTKQTFEIDNTAENSRLFKEYKCKEFSRFGFDQNTNAQHSRVRISGRVGLTEDEKYVLNCTATVDNKPITTIFNPIENSSSRFFISNDNQPKYNEQFKAYVCGVGCNKTTSNKNYQAKAFHDFNMRNYYARCNNFNNNNEMESPWNKNDNTCFSKVNINQRDSNIQVDFENINCNSENITQNAFRSKNSQSTQVDFNIQLPYINSLRNQDKGERNQCKCNNLDNIISKSGNKVEENNLRAFHNPIVIISVYPKQETSETKKIQKKPEMEDFRRSQLSEKYVSSESSKRPDKRQINNTKSNLGSARPSRSPSPIKNVYVQRNKNTNPFERRIVQTAKRKVSPPRHFNGVANNMTQNKEKIKQETKFAINNRDTCTKQNQETMNSVLKSRESKNVQAQLKKSLVEDYTKMLTGNINGNCCTNESKNENSKVNIKIDGDNENYDLMFNQGKLKTDLRIRKTVKETGSQKYEGNDQKTRKDFSLVSNTKPTRRKLSPIKQTYQSNGVLDSQNHTSTLNPRDSIEIFHRRETSHRMKDTKTQSAKESDCNENNTDFFAPIKHYRGDDCEIPNPVERDKQIRELLGIVKEIPTKSKQEHKLRSVSEDHSMIQCFYSKTCNKHLETGVSTYNSYSCYCMSNKNEPESSGDYENEYCQKNIGTKPSVDETSSCQQLILNRNIQIFLQVEQFTKQKPIILSSKQYNKVKKIIQKNISRRVYHDKRKNSIISIGEVRKRTKPDAPVECEYAKCTQTNSAATVCNEIKKDRKKYSYCKNRFEQRQVQTVVLFDSKKAGHSNITDTAIKEAKGNSEKRAVSSLEIHYTNVAYMKSDTFSSTNVESLSSTSFNQRNNSLYTIFKVHRKTPTPNLGTSVLSLLTNSKKLKSNYLESSSSTPNIKTKKPFLRRLMSCLVMQSRLSEKKIPTSPAPKAPSVNSSLDSYHINTSLGAIEMTSSVYDTSASFYSNHDVCPAVNNKMKRGFFSSVRGFLTSL